MTDGEIKKLARKIARELFTSGAGEKVVRLQIKLSPIHPGMQERNGGGWCEQAVIDVVEKALRE